jgi:hypothetical protein
MNNQKRCFFCHSGGMKLMPIKNSQGYVIATHNLCRTCNKDQTAHSLAKRKKTLLRSSKKSIKRTPKKSRLGKGLLVGLVSAVLTFSGCNALASIDNSVTYQAQIASSTPQQASKQEAPKIEQKKSTTTVKEYVLQQAKLAGVHVAKIDYMVKNESHYNPKATGDHDIICLNKKSKYYGEPVYARGLWQITRCWHPEITDEQAFDPEFSTAWALSIIASSKQDCIRQWATCDNWYKRTQKS